MLRPRKLGHVGIFVKDLERSKKFYTEVVGLKVVLCNSHGGSPENGLPVKAILASLTRSTKKPIESSLGPSKAIC